MNYPRMKLTTAGIEAMMKAAYEGAAVQFTCIKIGSGSTTQDFSEVTDLVHVEKTLGITSCTVSGNMATLTFLLQNTDIQEGFFLRELGVFASVNGAADILYAYTNAGSSAAYLQPFSENTYVNMEAAVNVAIGSAENVTAIISGATGYVKQEDFDAHLQDYNNPHRVTKEQLELGNVVNKAPNDMVITFTKITTLQDVNSGDMLSNIVRKLASAISFLKAHLADTDNPHDVKPNQIGAAEEEHTHKAGDIMSGTLPVARGGTGVNTTAKLKTLVRRTITYTTGTLSAQSWTASGTYDLGQSGYNLDVGIAPTASAEQQAAYMAAKIAGSAASNTLTALGSVPDIDIPVIIRAEEA